MRFVSEGLSSTSLELRSSFHQFGLSRLVVINNVFHDVAEATECEAMHIGIQEFCCVLSPHRLDVSPRIYGNPSAVLRLERLHELLPDDGQRVHGKNARTSLFRILNVI